MMGDIGGESWTSVLLNDNYDNKDYEWACDSPSLPSSIFFNSTTKAWQIYGFAALKWKCEWELFSSNYSLVYGTDKRQH